MPVLSDDQIVTGLTEAMERAAVHNTNDSDMPSWEDPISVFFSVSKPEIETVDYIKRLVKYAECSKTAFAVVLVYLNRLEKANEKLAITYYNMHRLLITALMLAAKMLDDRCYSNAHYARVGGISSVSEVNRLELQMLTLLDYKLIVTPEEYVKFVLDVKKHYITRSPTTVNPSPQPPQQRVSSQVSNHTASGYTRQQPHATQQSYSSLRPYPSQQPGPSQRASAEVSQEQPPPPIQASGRLVEAAFKAHSNNSSMNLSAFADALNTLAIPQCSDKDWATLVNTGGSCNIGRCEFFEILPSILLAAAFSRADVGGNGNLDLRGFHAALQILGIDVEYGHLLRYFEKADSDHNMCIGREDFNSVLRTIVHDRKVSFDHMLLNFRNVADESAVPDDGFAGVTAQMAAAAFASVDTEKKGYLDLAMFKDALRHLHINVEKNYEKVMRYFGNADRNSCGRISKERFIALFSTVAGEASKNMGTGVSYKPTTQYGLLGATPQSPMSHTMVSNYNSVRRIYKFEAPGHEFQVLPLHEKQGAKPSGRQYSSTGVRSRVYR